MRGAWGLMFGLLGFVLGVAMMPASAQGNSMFVGCVTTTPITGEHINPSPSPSPYPGRGTNTQTNTPAPTATIGDIFKTATKINEDRQTASPTLIPTLTTVPRAQSPTPRPSATATGGFTNPPLPSNTPKPYIVPPTPTQEIWDGSEGVVYTVNYSTGMYVRVNADPDSAIIGSLNRGATVSVYEEKQHKGYWWGRIDLNGRVGWVALRQSNGYQFLVPKESNMRGIEGIEQIKASPIRGPIAQQTPSWVEFWFFTLIAFGVAAAVPELAALAASLG